MAEPLFDIEDTPDPNEFSFWVRVSTADFIPSRMPKAGVTTYREFNLACGHRMNEEDYGSYIFTATSKAETRSFMRFWFAKPKDEEEKWKPFREKSDFVDGIVWYPIVKDLKPAPDPLPRATAIVQGNQEGIAQSDRYYWKRRFIPDTSQGTKVITREYLSPTMFDIPQYETPQPGEIYVELPGSGDLHIPKCLHKGMTIQGVRTGRLEVVADVSSGFQSTTDDLHFPATNFTTWEPYIASAEQQQVNGVWHMVDKLYVPPSPSKIQTE